MESLDPDQVWFINNNNFNALLHGILPRPRILLESQDYKVHSCYCVTATINQKLKAFLPALKLRSYCGGETYFCARNLFIKELKARLETEHDDGGCGEEGAAH